jgi:exoribonuclease II
MYVVVHMSANMCNVYITLRESRKLILFKQRLLDLRFTMCYRVAVSNVGVLSRSITHCLVQQMPITAP